MNTGLRGMYRAVLILGALAGTARADTDAASVATLDTTTVESFIDAVMGEALARSYAPGAIVTVVEGDRIVLAKGYGVANVETRSPIDPQHTLFRIASITKLFTTVAALRLEEQGKLDLDADINRYLRRVKVPDTFAQPITSRLLMTHHGGFDTAVGYMDFPDARAAKQTPEQMSWDLLRARPVTALPLYDNMAFGALGVVVADVLNTSYADAVRREIFEPLGMDQSVSGLPDDRVADAAHAHIRNAQWHAELIPHNLMPDSAQGGGDISTTAVDMGRFMSAMLSPGKLLGPAALAKMTDFDTWRFNPRVPGLGLGMWQYFYHGHAAEGHRGEINGFISRVAWFRAQNVGIFVSVDTTVQSWPQPRLSYALTHLTSPAPPPGARTLDPDGLIEGVIGRFADHFLPAPVPPPLIDARAASEPDVAQLVGTYFRRDASTHLMARMEATMNSHTLFQLPSGQLSVGGCPFVRKGPLFYECAIRGGDTIRLGFRVVDGRRIFAGIEPVGAFERQPWWLTAPFAILPLPILMLLGLSALIARQRARSLEMKRVMLMAGLGAALISIALLLELEFAYDLAHSAWHILPNAWRVLFPAAAVLLLANAAFTLPAFRATTNTRAARSAMSSVYSIVLALGSLGLVWLMGVWGLLWPFR